MVRERAELPGHLPELIKLIEPAVIAAHERHPSDLVAAAIEENVKLNVKRMYGDSPILSEALAATRWSAGVGRSVEAAKGEVRTIEMELTTQPIANASTNFIAGK
ncbi:MAG: hypothetical protein WA453_12150 [Methyloceanibacter sp.]